MEWKPPIIDDVLISFRPIAARAGFDLRSSTPYVSMTLELDGDSVSTRDGLSLNDVVWNARILQGVAYNEFVAKNNAIGILTHMEAASDPDFDTGEMANFGIVLPEKGFSHLVSVLLTGRLPSQVTFTAKGAITYGSSWDGSSKVWDVKSEQSVFITDFSYWWSVGRNASSVGADDDDGGDAHLIDGPLTSSHVATLNRHIRAQLMTLHKSVSRLLYSITGILAFIAIILLVR